MHKDLIAFNATRRTKEVPDLHSGDVIKVYRKIVEGGKERTQIFQGMVIALKGGQSSSPTFTVRKVSFGIGVELILPLYSPNIEKIEVLKSTRSRRAKLYFVRDKSSKLLSKKLKEVAMKTGKGKKSAPAVAVADIFEEKVDTEVEVVKEEAQEESPKA
jgi:large subunit ribosomal protein L19